MSRRTYVAIMVAAAHGRGLHLTADEVFQLTLDDAIATYADNCLTEEELRGSKNPEDYAKFLDWKRIKP